jgi:hypothetical protein
MTGEELFWDLVEPMYADPAVQRSTMMGLPCVRLDSRFFASLDRRIPAPDRERWQRLLVEARDHAAAGPHTPRTRRPD